MDELTAFVSAWSGPLAGRVTASLSDLFLDPVSRLSWTSLLAAIGFAMLVYGRTHPKSGLVSARFLRFLAPARVYRGRSFRVDVKLLLFAKLIAPARLLVFGLSVSLAALWVSGLLAAGFGPAAPRGEPGLAAQLLLAALLILAYDFGTYVTHRLSHQVPLLWAFHRVHHSADQLNPLTVLRKHPVYDAVAILFDLLIVAPIQGVILYLWGDGVAYLLLLYVNIGFGLFGFAASTLRHSHIWLCFGPVASRLFVSPAMHQIHHSRAPRHWDRNYGEVFALWDWLFGSLYLPVRRERLEFGLADGGDAHPTLRAALLEPFGFAWTRLRGADSAR